MKKVIQMFTAFVLVFAQISSAKALTSTDYVYNYNDYNSEINEVYNDDKYINCDFVENDLNINLKVDKNMRYVIVNGLYYSFEDYNKATSLVSDTIYDNEVNSITVVDALKNFSPIKDINSYLSNNCTEISESLNIDDADTISASYGTFYHVGSYSKKEMTISLASSAVGLIVAFITSALGFGAASSYVSGFVSEKIAAWGVSKITADVWYKKYQAVMNSHGTTKERRYMGIKRSKDKSPQYSKKYIERQFETIRPV